MVSDFEIGSINDSQSVPDIFLKSTAAMMIQIICESFFVLLQSFDSQAHRDECVWMMTKINRWNVFVMRLFIV